MSRLLFLLPQAPMIMQVIFICSIEHVFYTAEAIIEKLFFSSVPFRASYLDEPVEGQIFRQRLSSQLP